LWPSARLLLVLLICTVVVGLVFPPVGAQTSYTVDVMVSGLPSTLSTNVYVDGAFNATMTGGQSRTFSFNITTNPHSITVDFYVPNSVGLNGTRYFVQDATWTFNLPGHHVFAYTPQYYLSVRTSYSAATGQGWYNANAAVGATLKDREIDEGQGTRQVFTGWAGGASGTDLTSNDIIMDAPKTAVANWKTQFYLSIQSDPPNVTNLNGEGWYDAGSDAHFSAAAIVSAADNTRLRFDHWSGDYTGQSPQGTVSVDRPKIVKAYYLAQYLLSIQYDPASISSQYNESQGGWYDANSNVQLGPVPSTIDLSTAERLHFNGWVTNGSQSSTLSHTVLMDAPHTVTLSYTNQYYVDVRSSQGSVTGSGWYDRGSTATITLATGAQAWPFSYTFNGWSVVPPDGNMVKTDDSWHLMVDKPYVVEAQWSFDYLPLILIFGGGAVVATVVAAGIVLARRRGALMPKGPVAPPTPPRSFTLPPATQLCPNCGNIVPKAAPFCDKCGGAIGATAAKAELTPEEKVYEYIVKHEGVISLSAASADLGISVEELKDITERLKKQGRLGEA
jgi:hypothetical protein